MVRSESADEEAVSEKFDMSVSALNDDDEDFVPQTMWSRDGPGSDTGTRNAMAPVRPISRSVTSLSPNSSDPDRRLRRQIANCNERRRMQSINAGFQSLRALLPRKEGEKLSKAAILQHTADLIHQLQSERSRYIENGEIGRKKPKIEVDDCADQQRSMISRLQLALERERTARMILEQELNQMREMYQNSLSATSTISPIGYAQQSQQGQDSIICVTPKIPTGTTVVSMHDSVIRPTPLIAPISVDVSSHISIPVPPAPSPIMSSTFTTTATNTPLSTPSAFSSSSITAHRSLQTILDAIRHLEGGALVPPSSSPPASQAPLVR
ncbi:Helix-loop-helix DNA-binding domain protein [Dictyocaulus viviparus]|uniref:Helix-loop-helix DNA-binding domain protein n=1 Tax=Dictyocaulus viviparus TaxID=29172 RepID=A0A0D8Y299_DICVI|nr:Helix-loop-helix DNA-binding domain protein [Dictyocaulus viviparus]